MNYLISNIITVRVPDVTAVEALHEDLRTNSNFILSKFEYTHKEIKQKGEVIDEYELVKATLTFNDVKEPINNVSLKISNDATDKIIE